MEILEQRIKELTPEEKFKLEEFLNSLVKNRKPKNIHKPTFKWAGGLMHLRDKYTAVELQHMANEWRTEGVLAGLEYPDRDSTNTGKI